MKSPDPLDPQRLEVIEASVRRDDRPDVPDSHGLIVTLTMWYSPWWDEPGQDVLFEQANALTCVREALQRGGVGHEF